MVETMKLEDFKDIPHYEGRYMINRNGDVWSIKKGCFLKPYKDGDGYLQVALYFGDGRRKQEHVHRLVALTYIPNPEHWPQVNHIDENKLNNSVENLEWCSQKHNINHGTRTARAAETTSKVLTNRKDESLPVLQFSLGGIFIKEYPSRLEAQRQTGINASHIGKVCKGVKGFKSAGGYIWKDKK